jgi:hypothetical protein
VEAALARSPGGLTSNTVDRFLLLTVGVRKLDPVNTLRKFGIGLLALVLFGTPLLNCVTPTQAMTAAEKECCKKMAAECGRAGMASSHSCCQSNGAADTRPLLKSASPTITYHTLFIANVISHFELLTSQSAILVSQPAQLHGPPGQTPPDTTVLRI